MKRRNIGIFVVIALVFVLSACGSKNEVKSENQTEGNTKVSTNSQEKPTTTVYPLTIQNFKKAEGGTTWEKKEQIFDKAPERIMANTRPAAELLLHLGLGDKIVGVGANAGITDQTVEAEYAKLNILSDSYVSKEVTLGTNPDLVLGRGGLFDNADWGVGTVDNLNEMGVKTYVLESSVPGGTYESVYKDIENIGKIFNVQEKANSYIKELKARQEGIVNKLAGIADSKTFVYLHTNDPKEITVYPAGDETFLNDAFKMIKLTNSFEGQTGEVGLETLIATDPDVLIVPNWSDAATLEKLKKGLYANSKLSSMKAIKNKQIYVVEFNYLFGYGYNTIDGMEILAKEMYPDLFK